MSKSRTLILFALLAVFAVGAGAVFAQNTDTPPEAPGLRGICRPDEERGAFMSALLGMDSDEIRDYIRNGGTIEELAEEKGVDLEAAMAAHKEARLSELETCLNDAVTSGEITQAQADMILERAQSVMGEAGPHGAGENGMGQRGKGGMGQRGEGSGFFGNNRHGTRGEGNHPGPRGNQNGFPGFGPFGNNNQND